MQNTPNGETSEGDVKLTTLRSGLTSRMGYSTTGRQKPAACIPALWPGWYDERTSATPLPHPHPGHFTEL